MEEMHKARYRVGDVYSFHALFSHTTFPAPRWVHQLEVQIALHFRVFNLSFFFFFFR